ncbi:uncharacterized protein LOC144619237 [Crassostrea virginica]
MCALKRPDSTVHGPCNSGRFDDLFDYDEAHSFWVYEGTCPNFFIPENNMFLNKVHGVAQRNLFAKLYRLYEKGEKFALQIPSISTHIHLNMIICDPILSAGCMLGEDPINSEALLDRTLFGGNKQMYITDKITCYMLKLASKFGFVSDLLYIAMYLYKTSRYREAICIIAMVKVKLEHPGLMYMGNTDLEKYTRHVAGQSFSKKMRNAVAQNIILDNNIFYITELIPEQQSGLRNNRKLLHIPPVILLHMIEFLCCRHVDPMKAQVVLSDLKRLIHHDQGVSVDRNLQNISWEILGICQQIAGNYQAALYSYQQALKHSGLPKIRSATEHRIKELQNTIAHCSSF